MQESDYRAYLLRLWKMTDAEGKHVWRATLERPGESRQQGFGTLDHVFDFIRHECQESDAKQPRAENNSHMQGGQ